MPEIQSIFDIASKPGIKRDGTNFDSSYYNDGQWVRFQRGKPKKIGGYRLISDILAAPIRATHTDSRASTNSIHSFSPWGVERLQVDNVGTGGAVYNRTPSGFIKNDNLTWSTGQMYSSTGGAFTALIAAATPDLSDISSDSGGRVYSGDVTGTSALTVIQDGAGDILVSGGCVVLQPFLFVYGSNGLIRNSNPNDYSAATGWTTGGSNYANSANPCGTKIIKGLPMRGGSGSPAGLFWSLDSLIRVTFTGGTTIWNFDTISSSISILSKNCVVEYDGIYFWAGVDRFYFYNGVVKELPNEMNLNYFFDNLNFSQRQKVWAMKIPRYGEIWWFYPSGGSTECNRAVIFNVRESTWYDIEIGRSAGSSPQLLTYPIMAGIEDNQQTKRFPFTAISGAFAAGDVITGATSSASGTILKIVGGYMNVLVNGLSIFLNGETISNTEGSTGTIDAEPADQQLDVIWQHEFGHDKIKQQNVSAIKSYIETTNMSFTTGGPSENVQPTDIQAVVSRIEPDFLQTGQMNLYVEGGSYANSQNTESRMYTFDPTTEFVDLRDQRRLISLKFESNIAGGHYEMGKVLATIKPGDKRG